MKEQEINQDKQEREKPSLLMRIVENHPFLSATTVGVLGAGIVGLAECGVKVALNHYGTDVNQFPVITPLLVFGKATFGYFNGYGRDNHKDSLSARGLIAGSALSCAGLNYLAHGG